MIRSLSILITLLLSASCSQPLEKAETQVSAPEPDSLEGRALRQLEARLGGRPELSGLTEGTEGGKPLLCGTAALPGSPPKPFALRNGFLILPEDTTAGTFAQLQAACARPVA
ncbi:MAG TPA: hypothetical protein VEA15_01465 [Caulobacteraceae bacterium]|nr:hypothetical protein [Caulobacteraceae bacterium]